MPCTFFWPWSTEVGTGSASRNTSKTSTGGRLTLGPGNLYGTIKKLLELELVDDAPSDEREGADPRRRYYHITPLGRRALEIETRELANVLDVARLKKVLR